jgi:hypothetical protein
MANTTFQEVALESTSGQYSLAVHTGIISVGNQLLNYSVVNLWQYIFGVYPGWYNLSSSAETRSPLYALFYLVVWRLKYTSVQECRVDVNSSYFNFVFLFHFWGLYYTMKGAFLVFLLCTMLQLQVWDKSMLNPDPDVGLCGRVHSAFYAGLRPSSKKLKDEHLYLF